MACQKSQEDAGILPCSKGYDGGDVERWIQPKWWMFSETQYSRFAYLRRLATLFSTSELIHQTLAIEEQWMFFRHNSSKQEFTVFMSGCTTTLKREFVVLKLAMDFFLEEQGNGAFSHSSFWNMFIQETNLNSSQISCLRPFYSKLEQILLKIIRLNGLSGHLSWKCLLYDFSILCSSSFWIAFFVASSNTTYFERNRLMRDYLQNQSTFRGWARNKKDFDIRLDILTWPGIPSWVHIELGKVQSFPSHGPCELVRLYCVLFQFGLLLDQDESTNFRTVHMIGKRANLHNPASPEQAVLHAICYHSTILREINFLLVQTAQGRSTFEWKQDSRIQPFVQSCSVPLHWLYEFRSDLPVHQQLWAYCRSRHSTCRWYPKQLDSLSTKMIVQSTTNPLHTIQSTDSKIMHPSVPESTMSIGIPTSIWVQSSTNVGSLEPIVVDTDHKQNRISLSPVSDEYPSRSMTPDFTFPKNSLLSMSTNQTRSKLYRWQDQWGEYSSEEEEFEQMFTIKKLSIPNPKLNHPYKIELQSPSSSEGSIV